MEKKAKEDAEKEAMRQKKILEEEALLKQIEEEKMSHQKFDLEAENDLEKSLEEEPVVMQPIVIPPQMTQEEMDQVQYLKELQDMKIKD